MPLDYRAFISSNPRICAGQPVVIGTRVPVRTVLACLAEGMDAEEMRADFPSLSPEGIRAVIAFAAISWSIGRAVSSS